MAALKDMNKFVECVFGVTLRPNGTGLLNVKEFCSEDTELISLEMLEQLLFERLLIADNIESYLIGKKVCALQQEAPIIIVADILKTKFHRYLGWDSPNALYQVSIVTTKTPRQSLFACLK